MKPKHTIVLSGSYNGDLEKLVKSLPDSRVISLSLVGREVTLKVLCDDLDDVKKSLKKTGVLNLNVLEWKRVGTTLDGSGRGYDNKKVIRITVIPSELGEGIKLLAFSSDIIVKEELSDNIQREVKKILIDAGVSDAFYTVTLLKKTISEKNYIDATKNATLQAIFEAGGIIKIGE